jgi:hypothetical protein
MALIRAELPLVLDPGHKEYQDRYFDILDDFEPMHAKLFHVHGSKKGDETRVALSDLERIPEKAEGGAFAERKYSEMYSETFTHKSYGAKTELAEELWDDLDDNMKSAFPMLYGDSSNESAENVAFSVLRDAFTTVGADGKTLCADDHPLTGGGTIDNKATAALSAATALAAEAAMMAWVSPNGHIEQGNRPRYLVVPTALKGTAIAVANAGANLGVLSITDANVVAAEYGLEVLVVPWLTDANDWFYAVDPAKRLQGLELYWRKTPSYKSGWNDEGRYWFMNTLFRMSVGWINPRQVYGSSVT